MIDIAVKYSKSGTFDLYPIICDIVSGIEKKVGRPDVIKANYASSDAFPFEGFDFGWQGFGCVVRASKLLDLTFVSLAASEDNERLVREIASRLD